MKRYVISRMNGCIFSFLLFDDRAVEIHCDGEDASSILDNIYIGRIRDIAKNINAAFVEIAQDEVAYLPLDEISAPVYTKKGSAKGPQQGDELLVQVSRERMKSKYPSLSTNLTLHGKYLLLTRGNTRVSLSSKLEKEKRGKLTGLIAELERRLSLNQGENRDFGWIVRTNAGEADPALLEKEMERLSAEYEAILKKAPYLERYSCLLKMPPAWVSRLSNLYESSVDQIVAEDEDLYEEARDYLGRMQPEDLAKLCHYQDMQPLVKRFSLEEQLRHALSERVWLSSGGYLVIQPTEALTVIDVNSGKYEGGREREKTFLKINREAALEAARQIRLRNLSGIILIDFINMDCQNSREELMKTLGEALRFDPVKTVLVDMTSLFLVEITRMKKERPLRESCQQLCPQITGK